MTTYQHFILATLVFLSCRVEPNDDQQKEDDTSGEQQTSNASNGSADNNTSGSGNTMQAASDPATSGGDAGHVGDTTSTVTVSHDSVLPQVLDTEGGARDASTGEQPLEAGQGTAAHDATKTDAGVRGNSAECLPIPLNCGDRVSHNTTDYGAINAWDSYDRTQRLESGKEVLYELQADIGCQVHVVLEDLETDLDLFLMGECEPRQFLVRALQASSTPLDIQTTENLEFTTSAEELALIVVDGYYGAEGSYSLKVTCECP